MNREAKVYMHNNFAGLLTETESGYKFEYDKMYLQSNNAFAVSKTMPVKKEVYVSNVLFPFFDGLIPEGWLLDLAETNWKINHRDRFGLLLACCKNCIGAVSVQQMEKNEELQK
jgi:serine/threonine-protein kinase HipA